MFVLCVTVLSVFICLSSAIENKCYGSTFVFPREHLRVFNQKVIFIPSNGGPTKVVKGNGEEMDPRFRPTLGGGAEMPDLTEQDNGEFFMKFGFTDALISIITLRVIDCRQAETRDYGSSFTLRLPAAARFLEFTPAESPNLVTVVWNRTDPNRGRGSVNRYYYWEITDITPEDNGYYKFRTNYNRLLAWKKLVVKEKEIDLHPHKGKRLLIEYPQITSIWTIIFKPLGKLQIHTLMKQGTPQWNQELFEGRLQFMNNAITIEPVQYQDSGMFEFRDKKDNLALRVEVQVTMDPTEGQTPTPMYFLYVAIPGGTLVCCYCIVCRKKSSSKRNDPAPETTAAPTNAVVPASPAVYRHDTTQPTGPGQSRAPPVPVNLPVYRRPTSTSGGPPDITQPTGRGHSATSPAPVSSNQPLTPCVYRQPTPTSQLLNVPAPGGPRPSPPLSTGSNFISSDSDPKFELERSFFASAPPLNSYTTIADVYTSGKLSLSEIHTSEEGEHRAAITDVYTSDKLNFKY